MPSPLFSRVSVTTALVTVIALAATIVTSGGTVFSPGGLHAGSDSAVVLGGVRAHVALARNCSACHASVLSTDSMSALCVHCHTDIQAEWKDSTTLHGAVARGTSCTSCHTEHLGASGALTSFVGLGTEHARFGFPLDGGHAAVSCASCHRTAGGRLTYRDTPTTCVGCHQQDDTHRGSYGTDCASCHSTIRWQDATFDHAIFPIDHGEAEEGTRSTCTTCHTNKADYKVYTCYGCHEHTPANVEREHRGEVDRADISACIDCHVGGREDGDRGDRRGRNGDRGALLSLLRRAAMPRGVTSHMLLAYTASLAP